MTPQYIYAGPTWAQRSFDKDSKTITNFANEWGIPYIDATLQASPPLTILDRVKSLNSQLPIVWIYSDPWGDVPRITGLTHQEYVKRADWFDIWRECNCYTLNAINQLGNPVLIIGTHCDVIDCDYNNITIANSSMQQWMATQAKIDIKNLNLADGSCITIPHCFAMEIYLKFFHDYPDIVPDPSLLSQVWDLYFFWKELEKNNLMYDVHPTAHSYITFSKELKDKVQNFLDKSCACQL